MNLGGEEGTGGMEGDEALAWRALRQRDVFGLRQQLGEAAAAAMDLDLACSREEAQVHSGLG